MQGEVGTLKPRLEHAGSPKLGRNGEWREGAGRDGAGRGGAGRGPDSTRSGWANLRSLLLLLFPLPLPSPPGCRLGSSRSDGAPEAYSVWQRERVGFLKEKHTK